MNKLTKSILFSTLIISAIPAYSYDYYQERDYYAQQRALRELQQMRQLQQQQYNYQYQQNRVQVIQPVPQTNLADEMLKWQILREQY